MIAVPVFQNNPLPSLRKHAAAAPAILPLVLLFLVVLLIIITLRMILATTQAVGFVRISAVEDLIVVAVQQRSPLAHLGCADHGLKDGLQIRTSGVRRRHNIAHTNAGGASFSPEGAWVPGGSCGQRHRCRGMRRASACVGCIRRSRLQGCRAWGWLGPCGRRSPSLQGSLSCSGHRHACAAAVLGGHHA